MSGRYDGCEQLVHVTPRGTRVPYLAARILPTAPPAAATTEVQPSERHRLDLVAYRTLGNAELGWRIADANDAMDPFELCARAGMRLRLPGSPL